MSFWTKSTGTTVTKETTTGSFESQTDLAPIPDKTLVTAAITEAKWAMFDKDSPDGKTRSGERYISLRWDVINGEYAKRVVFQKLKVDSANDKTRDNAIDMLAAIDVNAGGKLMTSGQEPTDQSMMQCLASKPMVLRLRVWETEDKTKSGNWIDAVSSAKRKPQQSAPVQQAAIPAEPPIDIDDDIPF